MSMQQRVIILGATGSIGTTTRQVIQRNSDVLRIVAVSAHSAVHDLASICHAHACSAAAVIDTQVDVSCLAGIEVFQGSQSNTQLLDSVEYDVLVNGIVGVAGLEATVHAAQQGKRIVLANKESLVSAGNILMDVIDQHQAELVPIDSEHNALWQCLGYPRCGQAVAGVDHVVITASGGPLRMLTREQLPQVTVAQACAHPNWSMGKKVSVDSATMINKSLEMLEAHWLFALQAKQIRVVLHPKSIVHGLVGFIDGSLIAHLGPPDMAVAIGNSLGSPNKIKTGIAPVDVTQLGTLEFMPIDERRFPIVAIAREIIRYDATQGNILNAANEVAVAAFLNNTIRFDAIDEIVLRAVNELSYSRPTTIDEVLYVDQYTRRTVDRWIASAS